MNLPPPLPSQRKKSSWVPLVVSIVAFPGLGQLMQKRKIVGGILTTLTVCSAAWLMYTMIHGTWINLKNTLETGETDTLGFLRSLAQPARVFGIIWLVSSVDVLVAHWRIKARTGRAGN
jgi:hypothetical protein